MDKKLLSDPDWIKFQAIPREELEAYFQNANIAFKMIQDSCHRVISRWAGRFTGQCGWIVDIGCGAGWHFKYMHNGNKLLGVDSDIRALKIAKERYPQAMFVVADVSKLPLKEHLVDAAVSIYVLEHVRLIDEVLREVRRILKEDCRFFVGLPLEGGFFWNTGRRLTSQKEFSKKYGIDYAKVIKIEHCNTAKKVIDSLRKVFILRKKSFFPFRFIPSINFNLTVSIECVKEEPRI